MFFKKNKSLNENNDLIKVAALLIHAAKIDQDYSIKEEYTGYLGLSKSLASG